MKQNIVSGNQVKEYMEKTDQQKQIEAWQDEDFANFMHGLARQYNGAFYKKGNFLKMVWSLWRIHRKAKKYQMSSLLQITLGKDL